METMGSEGSRDRLSPKHADVLPHSFALINFKYSTIIDSDRQCQSK